MCHTLHTCLTRLESVQNTLGSLLHPNCLRGCICVTKIVSFCCFTKILQWEPWLKFKVAGREICRVRQTFKSGCLKCHHKPPKILLIKFKMFPTALRRVSTLKDSSEECNPVSLSCCKKLLFAFVWDFVIFMHDLFITFNFASC